MASYYGTNATKYNAGGTGDNYIPDGYIKSVEKIWLDYYTLTSSALTTADTIQIASIPPNKKITDVMVVGANALFSNTSCTLNVGLNISGSTQFIKAKVCNGTGTVTAAFLDGDGTGFQYLTTGTTNTIIVLSLGVAATTVTGGTIRTIVRYT